MPTVQALTVFEDSFDKDEAPELPRFLIHLVVPLKDRGEMAVGSVSTSMYNLTEIGRLAMAGKVSFWIIWISQMSRHASTCDILHPRRRRQDRLGWEEPAQEDAWDSLLRPEVPRSETLICVLCCCSFKLHPASFSNVFYKDSAKIHITRIHNTSSAFLGRDAPPYHGSQVLSLLAACQAWHGWASRWVWAVHIKIIKTGEVF